MEKSAIRELLILYYNRQTTDEQELELAELLNRQSSIDELDPVLRKLWSEAKPDLNVSASESVQLADTIYQHDHVDDNEKQYNRVHFLKTSWVKYAAAILIILGAGAYLYTSQQNKKDLSSTGILATVDINDIAPGTNKGVLTLSDGSTIMLDSAANGQIAKQQGSNVLKKGGLIIYASESGDPSFGKEGSSGQSQHADRRVISYNTMSTPRGGQYQLTLPDGTQVWLNAASSITYPVAFIGNERTVKISGEVYFEVKKNAAQPFIVQTLTDNIQVLGTSFNVNAYPDERSMKASLLEGSVKIGRAILKPGQAYTNGKVVTTNVEEDVAWKNGYFNFNNADLPTVMKQLERWYDITVKYPPAIPKYLFKGKLDRGLNLKEALEILHDQGIEYSLKERTLIISP